MNLRTLPSKWCLAKFYHTMDYEGPSIEDGKLDHAYGVLDIHNGDGDEVYSINGLCINCKYCHDFIVYKKKKAFNYEYHKKYPGSILFQREPKPIEKFLHDALRYIFLDEVNDEYVMTYSSPFDPQVLDMKVYLKDEIELYIDESGASEWYDKDAWEDDFKKGYYGDINEDVYTHHKPKNTVYISLRHTKIKIEVRFEDEVYGTTIPCSQPEHLDFFLYTLKGMTA